jgi:hypothetical protein
MDGIPCKLCAPDAVTTFTNPISGVTHLYRTGCDVRIVLNELPLKWLNVGYVPVTCLGCIALEIEPKVLFSSTIVQYAKDDARMTIAAAKGPSR